MEMLRLVLSAKQRFVWVQAKLLLIFTLLALGKSMILWAQANPLKLKNMKQRTSLQLIRIKLSRIS